MQQDDLWQETWLEALGAVVDALGGPKKVGAALWPALPIAQAGRKVSHCLKPSHKQRFAEHEWLWILRKGRDAGCHTAMHFLCDEVGYERAEPANPEDEISDLQSQITATAEQLDQLVSRFERVADQAMKMRRGKRR